MPGLTYTDGSNLNVRVVVTGAGLAVAGGVLTGAVVVRLLGTSVRQWLHVATVPTLVGSIVHDNAIAPDKSALISAVPLVEEFCGTVKHPRAAIAGPKRARRDASPQRGSSLRFRP